MRLLALVLCLAGGGLSVAAEWIPFDVCRDIASGSALDFSSRLDAPAGKYGWLKAVGDHFEFEGLPGVKQRFYGVNLCMSLNVPDTHADADRLVDRLAAMGYNSLRIHHHDAYCVGWRPGGQLSDREMEKFDYLYARAIAKGLYLTTDLFVSRRVTWREIGEDRDGQIDMNAYKALTLFHAGAFADWKRFAENFLRHVNRYTGRAYIDEPALPLLCTVNEGWLLGGWFKVRERPEVVAAYAAWRDEKIRRYGTDFMFHSCATNATEANCYGWKNAATALFLSEFQEAGHARQVAFLRSLGVKALLTAGNHGPNNAPNGRLRARAFDYVDAHSYVDHPNHLNAQTRWGLPSWCENADPIASPSGTRMDSLAWSRVADKPFTVTEWTFCGPGEARGICGLYGGALMARQDWSGVWRFAYGHDKANVSAVPSVNEVPGYFNVSCDPLVATTERTIANLFLRGDMPSLVPRVNLVIDAASLMPEGPAKGDWESRSLAPKNADAVWAARCTTSLTEVPGARNLPLSDWGARFGSRTNAVVGASASDGSVSLDRAAGAFSVATPRTCGVFARAGEHRAGPLVCRIEGGSTTVTVMSLDGLSLDRSRHLLVAHLTDCRGVGAVSRRDDEGRYVTETFGKGGVVLRPGRARVSLAVAEPNGWRAYALSSSGLRRHTVAVAREENRISFEADVCGADGRGVLEYELERKGDVE